MPNNFPSNMEDAFNRYNELIANERRFARAKEKERGVLGGIGGVLSGLETAGVYGYHKVRNALAAMGEASGGIDLRQPEGDHSIQSVAQTEFGRSKDEIGLDLTLEGIAGAFGSGNRTGLTERRTGVEKPILNAPGSDNKFLAVMRSKDPVAVDRFLSKHPYTGNLLFGLARQGADPLNFLDLATIPAVLKSRQLFKAVNAAKTPLAKTKLVEDALTALKPSSGDAKTFIGSLKNSKKWLEKDAVESLFTRGKVFNRKAPFALGDADVDNKRIIDDVLNVDKQAAEAQRVPKKAPEITIPDVVEQTKLKPKIIPGDTSKIRPEILPAQPKLRPEIIPVESAPVKKFDEIVQPNKIPVTDTTETPLAKTIAEGADPRLNNILDTQIDQTTKQIQSIELKALGYTEHDILHLPANAIDDIIFDGIDVKQYKELAAKDIEATADTANEVKSAVGDVNKYANEEQVNRYNLFKKGIDEKIHTLPKHQVEDIISQINDDVKYTNKLTAIQSDELLSRIAKKQLGQTPEVTQDLSKLPINDMRRILKNNNVKAPRGTTKKQLSKLLEEAKKKDDFVARLIDEAAAAQGSFEDIAKVKGVARIDTFQDTKIVTMDNGVNVAWKEVDELPVGDFVTGYDKLDIQGKVVAGSTKVNPTYVTVTATDGKEKQIFVDAIAYLAKEKGVAEQTIRHEFVHVAEELELLLPEEMAVLTNKFGDIEKIAEAYATWDGKTPDTTFQSIKNLFKKLYEAIVRPTASGTFERLRSGEVFKRKVLRSKDNAIITQLKHNHIQSIRDTINNNKTRSMFTKTLDEIDKYGIKEAWRRSITTEFGDYLTSAKKIGRESYKLAVKKGYFAEHAYDKSAEYLIQELPGMLGRMEDVLGISVNKNKHGLSVADIETGKMVKLYSGSMQKNLIKPIADFLKKTKGKLKAKDILNLTESADEFVVAKRAIAESKEVDRAIAGTFESMRNPSLTPIVGKKLRRTGILNSEQVLSLQRDIRGAAKAELEGGSFNPKIFDRWEELISKNAKEWRDNRITGAGGKLGDLEYHNGVLKELDNAGLTPTMNKVAAELEKAHKAKLIYAHQKGLISDEVFIALDKKKDYFAPLSRIMDEPAQGSGNQLLHTFGGSARKIENPFTTTAENLTEWIKAADTNAVKAQLIDNIVLTDMKNVVEEVAEPTADSIKVIHNGVTKHWKFLDEKLGESVGRIGTMKAGPKNIADRMLRIPAKVLRWTVTHSPPFAARNYIRDSLARMIISLHPNKKLIDIDAIKSINSNQVYDFVHSGGSMAGYYMKDLQTDYAKSLVNHIKDISTDKNTIVSSWDSVRNMFSKGLDKYEDFLTNAETVNRMSEFRDSRKFVKQKYPDISDAAANAYASFHSRRLTDFAEVGNTSEWINSYTAFFAPAIQGSRVMMRTAARDPKAFGKNLGWVAIPSIGAYLYNKSVGAGDEYLELPAYRRDYFLNFKIGNTWLTIPKPFELGVLGTGAERGLDLLTGNKNALDGYLGSLIKGLSPVDEGLFAGPLKPIIESLTNKDLFRDRYITPPWEEGLAPELQKMRGKASRMGKFLSSMVSPFAEADPRKIDHILKSVFADFGRATTSLSDIGRSDKPRSSVSRTLFGLSSFIREPSPYGLSTIKVLERQKKLGISRTRGANLFRKQLREATSVKTISEKAKLTKALIPVAKKRLETVQNITIKDILDRRKAREAKRQKKRLAKKRQRR